MSAIRSVVDTPSSEVEAARAQLGRLRSDLAEFAYVASHDLAEPLAVIAGYSRLLAQRYREQLGADGADFVRSILDAVATMESLLDDLRSYSRVGTHGAPFEPVDTGAVAREAVDLLGPSLEAHSTETHIGALPTIEADPGQLVALFRALLSNALKFHSSHPLEVRIEAEREGPGWTFTVTDNGRGVPEADRERIFGMFERVDQEARRPGNGAGLATSRRIVERHGGRIWAEPVSGGGSAFRFTLPERQRARQ